MSDKENPQNNQSLLDWIRFISTNCETGRLWITAGATRGYLLFKDGRLGAARLGLLTGFRAVNAAVSMRGVKFSFDHSSSAPTETAITANERVVLKQFFGIETVEAHESADNGAREVDWDLTPSQVVPLNDVQNFSGNDPENPLPLEVEPVVPIVRDNAEDRIPTESIGLSGREFPTLVSQSSIDIEPSIHSLAKDPANFDREALLVRKSRQRKSKAQKTVTNQDLPSFSWRPQIVLYLILLLALTAGAIALIPRVHELRESASVTNKIEDPSQPISPPQSTEFSGESLPVPERRSKELASDSPSVAGSQSQNTGIRNESPSVPVAQQVNQTEENAPNAQNLTGKWTVVNTVEKTNYRAFGNLKIGFRLMINQTGREFTAKGEKVSENGRSLPARGRTLIKLTGSIDGDKVEANFVEYGPVRRTKGRFVWRLENAGSGLTGTFLSTAARSSGRSAAIKEL